MKELIEQIVRAAVLNVPKDKRTSEGERLRVYLTRMADVSATWKQPDPEWSDRLLRHAGATFFPVPVLQPRR